MNGNSVRVLPGQDAGRRVVIVERNGLYVLDHQYRYETRSEGGTIAEGWASVPGTHSYYGDAVVAERGARAAYPWLA